MSHDPHAFRPLDPSRINALDVVELRYWCIDLGCSERQLNQAISTVGDHVAAVREFLNTTGSCSCDTAPPRSTQSARRRRPSTAVDSRDDPDDQTV